MRKSRFTETQIIEALKDDEAGRAVADLARELSVSAATFYGWRRKYGGMDVSEARRLRELEAENARPRATYAESQLDNKALKDALSKKW